MIRLAVLKRPFLAWILASIGARCTAQCDGAESGAPKAPKPLRYADCDKSDSALVAGKSAERSLNPNTRALSYVAGGRTNKFQSGLSEDTQSMTMQACPCATRSVSRKKGSSKNARRTTPRRTETAKSQKRNARNVCPEACSEFSPKRRPPNATNYGATLVDPGLSWAPAPRHEPSRAHGRRSPRAI